MRNSIYRNYRQQPSQGQPPQNIQLPQLLKHQSNPNPDQVQYPAQNAIIYQQHSSAIRQFLNMKRITKDKCCLILFLLYSLALIVMMGIGFFYGNYGKLGVFINGNAAVVQSRQQCPKFVSTDFITCTSTCNNNYQYLGRVCMPTNTTQYNPNFSTQVLSLISMYDIKYTFGMITYVSAGLMFVTGVIFIAMMYFSHLVYILVAALFFMLLGMSFYLLKNVQVRISNYNIVQNSILYGEEQNTRAISFLLLGLYLLIFPFVLFSPKKIKMGTYMLQKLKQFYYSMSNMVIFTMFIIVIVWGSLILEIFLIMHFYTAGTVSETPNASMFYTYQDISLSHPASLTFHFIGIFWVYSTLISWHKYFISSAMCLWYFQDSQRLYPVKRGLKRSLHHLGSAALDGILMPLQWVLLLLYTVFKTNDNVAQGQNRNSQDRQNSSSCLNGCFRSIRQFFMAWYSSINRNAPSSAALTNYTYFESCQNATQIISQNSHRFFNIGGTLTIFLTLFVCILWIIVMYFIVYAQIYAKAFPPLISSVVLPVFCVFIIGLVLGSLFSNIFTASLDCLLYCYLIQRKTLAEGGAQLDRGEAELKIKKHLDQCFSRSQEEFKTHIYIYEELDQNTMDLNYVTKKE